MKQEKVSVDKKMILIVTVLITLTMAPLMFQGIICNDELLTRYWRKLGIQELIEHYFSVASAGGRRMGAFVDVRLISFISNNMFINRIIDILLLLTAVAFFIYFIYKMRGSKGFSCFLGIMLIVCLPITFEHGAPNAFVAVICVPLILLILSCLIFWKYLLNLKRKYLVTSMVLYFIAMMQYEFVVTYVLLMYVLIVKYQLMKEKFDFRETFRTALIPTVVSIFYIFAYFLMQKSSVSNYSGTTVGFVSIKNSLEILMVLAKSSFPGYFLFNNKYKYLKMVYSEEFKYVNFLVIIMLLIMLILGSVLALIVKNNGKNESKWSWAEIGVALLFMFIPSMPNSISSLYQGNVTESFFTWLPVSLFLYFATTYLLCSVIWKILTYIYIYIYIYIGIRLRCLSASSASLVMQVKFNS
ncbi:hypothetical protein AALB52_00385 [Lachnospiraceae bacterium 38-14]